MLVRCSLKTEGQVGRPGAMVRAGVSKRQCFWNLLVWGLVWKHKGTSIKFLDQFYCHSSTREMVFTCSKTMQDHTPLASPVVPQDQKSGIVPLAFHIP